MNLITKREVIVKKRRLLKNRPLRIDVILFVSCSYSNMSGIPKRGQIVFFRSVKEYEDHSVNNNWEAEKKLSSTWCVRPREIEASVEEVAYRKFIEGECLPPNSVMFTLANISEVNKIR